MTCTCPKCHAKIDLDLPEVTEAGSSATCPSCNAKISLHRESFGGRALHKASEVCCASCGGELGPRTHCASCGSPFPDILVAGMGRKSARRDSRKIMLKSSPFAPLRKTASPQLPSMNMDLKPEAAKGALYSAAATRKYPKPVVFGVLLLLILALAGGGGAMYFKWKAEKEFAANFVMASYSLQTGIERAQKSIVKTNQEWKAKLDQGQAYTPRATADDDRDFGIIAAKLDPALAKLNQPPEKFATCKERLTKLQAVYNKERNLVLTPGTSWQGFVDANNRLDGEYKQAVKEYRSGMPDELMQELVSASMKFKGLRALLH